MAFSQVQPSPPSPHQTGWGCPRGQGHIYESKLDLDPPFASSVILTCHWSNLLSMSTLSAFPRVEGGLEGCPAGQGSNLRGHFCPLPS